MFHVLSLFCLPSLYLNYEKSEIGMAKYEIAFTLHNIIKVSLDLKALPLIYRVVISFLQEGLVSNMESVYHDVYNKTLSMYCFQPLDDHLSYI